MILGRRGSGKTDYFKGNASHNLRGLLSVYKAKGIKVLIIDTLDHPSYRDIPVMAISDLPKWSKGIYRVWVNAEDIPKLNRALNKLDNIWNTLLVYEDAYKHTFVNVDKNLRSLIADSKQKNIDILFMYHSWAQAPVNIYRMIDLIEVFKTKDSPLTRKAYMSGYYDDAFNIWQSVMNDKSNYAHKLIDTGLN